MVAIADIIDSDRCVNETKTGINEPKWDEVRDQIGFTLVTAENGLGKLNDKAKGYWIPTRENAEGELEVTGDVHIKEFTFTEEDRKLYLQRIVDATEKGQDLIDKHQPEVLGDVVPLCAEFIKRKRLADEATKLANETKELLLPMMKESGIKKVPCESEGASVLLVEKGVRYIFSDELEAEIKEIDEKKGVEKATGTFKKKTSSTTVQMGKL